MDCKERIKTKNKTKKKGNPCKTHKIRTNHLQMVCKDSGECLSFGSYTKEIQRFFKFTSFQHVVGALEPIGGQSSNGFIRKINYERDHYTACSVLKSTVSSESDSLVYEYLVGVRFINDMALRFPCFVSTYGLFFYNNYEKYMDIQYKKMADGKLFLKQSLTLQDDIDFKKACIYSQMATILIQYINHAISAYTASQDATFTKYHMAHVLFIIYQTLASLSKVYTHYDLHIQNVLLFRPHPNKTIRYTYHLSDGSILTFYCPYVPKIIDYGRSYFNNGKENSKQIYDKICLLQECGKCGEKHGFSMHKPQEFLGISSQRKNESHDLMLWYNLHRNVQTNYPKSSLKEFRASTSYRLLEKVGKRIQYNVGIPLSRIGTGTREDTTLHPKGDIVANVTDACQELTKIVLHPTVVEENQPSTMVLGTFHIYEDGKNMEYFKV